MSIWDRITDRVAQWREDRSLQIIDDLNEEPRGYAASDARDRRGQNDGLPGDRHWNKPEGEYAMRERRMEAAEEAHAAAEQAAWLCDVDHADPKWMAEAGQVAYQHEANMQADQSHQGGRTQAQAAAPECHSTSVTDNAASHDDGLDAGF